MSCGKCPSCGTPMHRCPQCNGTGRKSGYSCKHCGGTGCICPRRHEKSGGCFITTATVTALGKDDDCCELTTFRGFRDNWLRHQPGGNDLILQYYHLAPSIVATIDSCPDAVEKYGFIWEHRLKNCYYLITEQRNEEACEQYLALMHELTDEYLS